MAAKMDIDPLLTHSRVYCVTGGGGYIGSWLVKTLLENGHTVHATLRDPGDSSKNSSLLSLPGAQERLRLFKADLSEEGSFDSAIHGCHGVFHVAASTNFDTQDPEAAAVVTLNVMKSCKRAAQTVRRVVFTSSLSAASPVDKSGVVDESCWTAVDYVTKTSKHPGLMYMESKTLSEKAALQFGKENPEVGVVSVVLPMIAGPSITSTPPLSLNMAMSMITGNPQWYTLFVQSKALLGNSIAITHVQDVCNAHLFLMEHPAAEGRYLCCGHINTIPEFAHIVSKCYPDCIIKEKLDESVNHGGATVSSKKLSELGFNYKYSVEEIIEDGVQYFKKLGIIN